MNHAPELRRSFHALPINLRHHVIFFSVRLCRRAVRNDLSQHTPRSAESFSSLACRCHFMGFNAQPARAVVADENIYIISRDFWHHFDPPGSCSTTIV